MSKSELRPVLSPGSRKGSRLSLAALPLAMVTCGDPGQLEPDANAVAVTVIGLTADATKLVVTPTLDGKAATTTTPFEVTSKLTHFGLRMAKELSGTLTIAIDAYDVELCKVGTGSVNTPVGKPWRYEVSASMKTVSPRQCPPPPPPKTCAPNLFCWSNPLPQGNTVQALWALSASDVWAVGDAGSVFHYDGTKWSSSSSGTTETLYGVWAASASEVVAVGTNGKVIRWNGTNWTAEASGTAKRLTAIWGNSTDAWAVGEGGTIIKRSGGTWSSQTSGVTSNLNGVWGRSSSEVYAVGDTGVIRKFDGSNWTAMTSTTTMNLSSMVGDATSAVAVGQNGTIVSLSGSTWSAQTSGTTEQLSAVFSPASGQFVSVGTNGTILRGSAGTWTSQPAGTSLALTAVRGTGSSDIWSAGVGGQLMRYDGTKWTSSRSGFERNIRSVAALKATDVWAVGDGGYIGHYDGTKWTDFPSGTTVNLNGVYALSATEVYAVGDNKTFLRYLGSSWQPHPAGYATIAQDVKGIWAFAGTNIWTVATTTTPNQVYVGNFNGISYSGYTPTDPAGMNRVVNVNGMWATQQGANTLIFFAGKSYAAFSNVNGAMVNTSYQFPLNGSELRAVWGTSATDVWVVGDNGFVIQYDGAWKSQTTGLAPANLYGVWKSAPTSELWMVGDLGMVWKYDGTAWAVKESTTRNKLQAITGISTTDFWVGGSSGTMLHTQPQ